MHLKEDAMEFADSYKLKTLLKQYSEFIAFPINLYASESVPKKVVDDKATEKKQEEEDKAAEKEGREKEEVIGMYRILLATVNWPCKRNEYCMR